MCPFCPSVSVYSLVTLLCTVDFISMKAGRGGCQMEQREESALCAPEPREHFCSDAMTNLERVFSIFGRQRVLLCSW